MDWQGKRYWLIGASDGLGAELAKRINAAGAEVIISARSEDKLNALVQTMPGKASAVPLDVRDLEALSRAAETIGQIDGMVYLAGVYWPFAAQDWDAEQAEAMADINFTGAVRAVGAVIAQMVERDSGHIVLTGSLSGFRGLPGAIGYAASKAGVMALGESLQADLWRSGVKVQIANPGFIRTRLTDKNDFQMPFLMTPEAAAQQMFEMMCDPSKPVRHFPLLFSWLFRFSRFLPHWAYNRLFA